jgi:hypothetical protein
MDKSTAFEDSSKNINTRSEEGTKYQSFVAINQLIYKNNWLKNRSMIYADTYWLLVFNNVQHTNFKLGIKMIVIKDFLRWLAAGV